jgi:hypothetical protein
MNLNPLTADLFICGVYEYREEAFDMRKLLSGEDLVGGVSPNPALPSIVSLDMQQPLDELRMFTNSLRDLAAPAELCVQKALELISRRSDYEMNLQIFRMDLLSQVLAEVGQDDVEALIEGICCICKHLLITFDNLIQKNSEFFPYEYYTLHQGRYLFMSKIAFDANIPAIRPATVIQPAIAYPQVQARPRANYSAQADQCIVL